MTLFGVLLAEPARIGPAATVAMTIPGAMVQRGFWLYVWRVETQKGDLLYVGRTGDNSSPNAVAPYTRMGQHLSFQPNQNALRKHLLALEVVPEDCTAFHLIAHGPIYHEVKKTTVSTREDLMAAHRKPRDAVAAMECKLADDLTAAGYAVMNKVCSKAPLDTAACGLVCAAFAEHFPKLGALAA